MDGSASGVRVRAMRDGDRPAVEHLLRELNVVEEAFTHDRNLADDAGRTSLAESETWIARDGGIILVAELSGIVAGVLVLAHISLDFNVRPSLRARSYVMELVVGEAYRRRGLGRLLLSAAEAHARSQGHCALLLNAAVGNDPAVRLYRQSGFRHHSFEMIKPLQDA